MLWADALRGILIILVVIGHALQYGDYENRLSWNIIYSFHMAAFFVISGYVSHRPHFEKGRIVKRAKQLLLPFMVWTLLVGIINGDMIEHCYVTLLHPDHSFWFLYVLFCITVLHECVLTLIHDTDGRNLLIFTGGVSAVGSFDGAI